MYSLKNHLNLSLSAINEKCGTISLDTEETDCLINEKCGTISLDTEDIDCPMNEK